MGVINSAIDLVGNMAKKGGSILANAPVIGASQATKDLGNAARTASGNAKNIQGMFNTMDSWKNAHKAQNAVLDNAAKTRSNTADEMRSFLDSDTGKSQYASFKDGLEENSDFFKGNDGDKEWFGVMDKYYKQGEKIDGMKESYESAVSGIEGFGGKKQAREAMEISKKYASEKAGEAAGSYVGEGGLMKKYMRGALALGALDYATGSRTSLTEQNGQRDIAGIPFI